MASQEHLQMLDNGDSTSTTTGGEDDSTTSSEDGDNKPQAAAPAPASTPAPAPAATATPLTGVQAMIQAAAQVDGDDDGNDESEEELVRVSAPPKKRIKLSLGLLKAIDNPSTPDLQSSTEPLRTIPAQTTTKSSPPTVEVPEVKYAPEPKTVSEANVVADTKTASEAEVVPDTKGESEANVIDDTEVAFEAKAVPDTKVDSKANPPPDTKVSSEVKVVSDTKGDSDVKPVPQPIQNGDSEAKLVPQPQPKQNGDSSSIDSALPKPATQPKTTSKAIPGPKLVVPSILKKKKSTLKDHKKPKGLKKLPTQANKAKAAKKKGIKRTSTSEDGEEIKAMIVDSDDGGEDDAVAAIVEEATPKNPTPKRRPANPVKAIRLPPMSSPGLLIPPTTGIYRGAQDAKGFTAPAAVFDHAMSLAGYTTEGRTKRPHRGSSVKRVVGDMFDSNVKFTLHFPKLVPDNLLKLPTAKTRELPIAKAKEEPRDQSKENGTPTESVSKRLIRALESTATSSGSSSEKPSLVEPARKRRKLMRFSDMSPLSLTIPYPDKYIERRVHYFKKVKERERSIVKFQHQEEQLEIAREKGESKSKPDGKKELKRVVVHPIPPAPTPPRINELVGISPDEFEDHHPEYPLKGKEQFVSHLDKNCFHIVEGRYFGLLTNAIADPHFVGPNAPGISGLTLSGGTGLATAHAGGGALTGSASVLAASASAVASAKTSGGTKSSTNSAKATSKKPTVPATNSGTANGQTTVVSKKKAAGPTPTASSSALRKLLEEGGEEAEKMKKCIIRAAVHASRSGKHGQSFRAPNGQVYPDVSKAFAGHAGLKPCMRCKNNKQGAYHCRLRRKHKEVDYDGSNSTEILAPLFQVPMNELLWTG